MSKHKNLVRVLEIASYIVHICIITLDVRFEQSLKCIQHQRNNNQINQNDIVTAKQKLLISQV